MVLPKIGDPVWPNTSNMPAEDSPASFSFLTFSIDPANDSKDCTLYAGLLKKRVTSKGTWREEICQGKRKGRGKDFLSGGITFYKQVTFITQYNLRLTRLWV